MTTTILTRRGVAATTFLLAALITMLSIVAGGPAAAAGGADRTNVIAAGDGVLYSVQSDGDLAWYKHSGADDGAVTWAANSGTVVGHGGWDKFTQIVSGGNGVLYVITPTGDLRWYDHTGFADGAATFAPNSGVVIGHGGWDKFSQVFSGGNGILYAITPAGDLKWYDHTGFADGAATFAPNSGTVIGHGGWDNYMSVVAGGNGLLYAISPNGDLHWYDHTGFADGTVTFAANSGSIVSHGWDQFVQVVSAGDGVLYGVTPNGDLHWYDHTGFADGAVTWTSNSGVVVSHGWLA